MLRMQRSSVKCECNKETRELRYMGITHIDHLITILYKMFKSLVSQLKPESVSFYVPVANSLECTVVTGQIIVSNLLACSFVNQKAGIALQTTTRHWV